MMRRTPLFPAHQEAGARFVEFGGWEMPVSYEGHLAEHRTVREACGLFDVSHMGEIEVTGAGALALCQRITTNDASVLKVGRAQYTIWCHEDGGTIDDTILYRLGAERYQFCVNAGNADACWDWIQKQAAALSDVTVTNRSEETGLIAVQGPAAEEALGRLPGGDFSGMPRFGCEERRVGGVDVLVARTGYTGEDGFEVFVPSADARSIWDQLLERGADLGVKPIGLGARDSLRLEAGLALYGHELERDISPLEAGLNFAVKIGRSDFIGSEALAAARTQGLQRKLIGLRLTDRGIARAEHQVYAGEKRVGVVTSGTKSPTLGDAIALALVEAEAVDARLSVEVRGKRLAAERVELPFYRREA